eukprot:5373509-Amphidinium_carterae.1
MVLRFNVACRLAPGMSSCSTVLCVRLGRLGDPGRPSLCIRAGKGKIDWNIDSQGDCPLPVSQADSSLERLMSFLPGTEL